MTIMDDGLAGQGPLHHLRGGGGRDRPRHLPRPQEDCQLAQARQVGGAAT